MTGGSKQFQIRRAKDDLFITARKIRHNAR